MPRYPRELQVARTLARDAGSVALSHRGEQLAIDYKPGNEPVTAADRAASELVVAGLERAFPDDVVISEETADDPRRLRVRRVWYVDPIDGTKDYIRGFDGFSVMIGLTVDHRPVMGVVYQPVGDRMFHADGEVALFESPGAQPQVLAVSTVDAVADIRLVASRSHRSRTLDRVKSALGIDDEFNIGSVGLKLGLIALGERDLYVNPSSKCKVWDTCAPEAILEAAGGSITDVHGDPLRYDRQDTRRRHGLVASNRRVHDAVIDRLMPLFPRQPAVG